MSDTMLEPARAVEDSTTSLEEARGAATMETMDIEEPLPGAQVFTTPDASAVRGKVFSTMFSIAIAGMNGLHL